MAETRDSSVSRDMLQRFTCGGGNGFPAKPKEEAHGRLENVELSLGLSLNGRFGAKPEKNVVNNDNNNNKKLFRASSVIHFMNYPVDVELSLYSPLTRTCSLPPETEAEWRKRKELQSLRRSEAKRKRVEKQKNVRVVKGKSYGMELWGLGSKQSPPQSPPALQLSSQGSIVSQGSGGSSGVSDLNTQPIGGINTSNTHESTSPSNNVQCIPKIEPKVRCLNNDTMPCVSTKGEGPNGKKIQGFLYRYGKGEEVRIVCVCHGSFLTPAEFVKHGGGGDVDHPLRHIIVTSCSVDV